MHIVAIGGGNKEPILAPIINRIETPDMVIIPTACSTEKSYDRKVAVSQKWCGEFGLKTSVLHEFGEKPSADKVAELLGRASIAYVIGGNTPYMLEKLPEHETDLAITSAVHRGMWLTGTSAGALLPFESGLSCPAKKPAEEDWDYTYVSTLGIVPGAVTAHANQVDPHPHRTNGATRFEHFAQTLPLDQSVGFGIDNHAALVIDGDRTYVSRSDPQAAVHLAFPNGETIMNIHDDQLDEIINSLHNPRN